MAEAIGIVGGGGFLGPPLAARLHAAGREVRVFSRSIRQRQPGVVYQEGRIEDGAALRDSLAGCRSLVYLAHDVSRSPYADPDRLALVRNLELFLQALETAEAAGVREVLLMSSGGAVYGPAGEDALSEDSPTCPVSAYGVAKLAMEHYLRTFAAPRGWSHLIVRPSNPYGPGQNGSRNQGVIPIFLRRLLNGQPLEIWGSTSNSKDYLYVDDFADAVAGLIAAGFDNRCYNVASQQAVSLAEIIAQIEAVTGAACATIVSPPRLNDNRRVRLDSSRLRARLGWSPRVSLEEGIRRTWEWLRRPSAG